MKRVLAIVLFLLMLFSIVPIQAATEKEYSLTKSQYVRILGRGEKQGNARTFNWPNAGFEFTFDGTTASVYVDRATYTYDDTTYNGNYFTIAVYDGDTYIRANRVLLKTGWNVIYKQGIRDPKVKTIMVVRSSEPWSGTIQMSKLKTDAEPKASKPRERLIEFIGDSVTTGYANCPSLSSSNEVCSQNTDNWYSYTGVVARHYKADNNVLAYYGKGVYANRSMSATNHTMSHMFEYQDPYVEYSNINMSTRAKHDFSDYQPDVVTIMLGGNDLAALVPNADFEMAYGKLLDNVRSKYPKAVILTITRETIYPSIIKRVSEAETRGEKNGIYFMTVQSWTSTSHGHPDVAEHERIANQIIKKLDSIPNVWGDEPVVTPPAPEKPMEETTEPIFANYNLSKVLVNGKEVAFESYNIDGNNHFKLRDLAMAFSGTEKQFEVTWDGTNHVIGLISKEPYTAVGGELVAGNSLGKYCTPYKNGITKDGLAMTAQAYNIEGNNYFKLRDICKLFDIGVSWDGTTSTISLDTSVGYTE